LRDDETLILFIWRSELTPGDPASCDPCSLLRRAFGDMGWEVSESLEQVEGVADVYVDDVSQIHLEHWSRGRVALLGDPAACASLLAGEGTGLAMVEAYVLAGEIHRAGSDLRAALQSYETRLRSFVRAKQGAAMRFRGFFAPETFWGLWLRDVAVSSLSVPFIAKTVLARSLRDDLRLPRFEAD
jgi:2-polyprenyl-6-methoxyphenol hydroxylase-like FAD-dependent oxidoreductase